MAQAVLEQEADSWGEQQEVVEHPPQESPAMAAQSASHELSQQ